MPLTEEELKKRDSQRDIAKELLDAVDQMKSGEIGYAHQVAFSPIAMARLKSGLSPSQFAGLLGVSVRTLMEWERGKRKPGRAANNLIAIATSHPEVLRELLNDRLAV